MSPNAQLPIYDWRIEQAPDVEAAGLPPPIARLIAMRGLADVADPASVSDFLDAPLRTLVHPEAVPGVAEAARAIADTMRAGGLIVIFGDFDCDGVTATAILTSMLRLLGASVMPFIPTRSEGYGLSDEAVARCMDEVTRASPAAPSRLLVTVDCGMGAGPALRRFLDAGYSVVVSDHHTPGDPLPADCTVISTFDPAMPAPCRHLCGAGLAYKIACGIVTLLHPLPDKTGRAELHAWMAPLAVATVADVMPMTGENRAYVREGLNILNRRPGIGMKALIRKAFERAPTRFTARDLGFVFGPHINAAGRLESCEPALRLLLAENDDEALGHATTLSTLNARRKTAENHIMAELDAQLADLTVFNPETDGAAVLSGHGWHPGVVGLAAGRLTERLSRPVVVIAIGDDGDARGSARAPERGYNLHSALTACSSLLDRFGGHAAAAGLSLREADIPAFRRAFAEECARQVGATHVRSELAIDGALGAEDIGEPLVAALRRLEPFGNGNPEPCWVFKGVTVAASATGKEEKKHLRVRLTREDGLDIGGVWFGAARFAPLFAGGGKWDVAGELVENEFRGETEIEISVQDARPHNLG